MINILHGDDLVSSRKKLSQLKETFSEVITLEGKTLDKTTLIQSLQSDSLFGLEKLVVIENLSALNLRTKYAGEIVNYLAKLDKGTSFIIWDQKILSAGVINKFKGKAKIELFKYKTVIFNFVDSLCPGSAKISLKFLRQALQTSAPEVVFAMIVRQFRLMIALKYDAKIEEAKRLISWQIGKLKRQAQQFEEKQLLQIYKELLIIDYQVKTGKSTLDLTKRIETFIMNL